MSLDYSRQQTQTIADNFKCVCGGILKERCTATAGFTFAMMMMKIITYTYHYVLDDEIKNTFIC